jgi:hypothetical protein
MNNQTRIGGLWCKSLDEENKIESRAHLWQARVDVFVYSGAPPGTNQLTIASFLAGYLLHYRGTPGRACELQRSTDLLQWSVLVQTTILPHGIVEYLELNPPVPGAYYRVIQQ